MMLCHRAAAIHDNARELFVYFQRRDGITRPESAHSVQLLQVRINRECY